MAFSRGVSYYTHGVVDINFPEDDVCCRNCPLMGIEMASSREYCRRTGEYIAAPKSMIGFECPIVFKEEAEKCSEI